MTFLESPEDMAWLAEVHTPVAKGYACAILHGNEDSPDRIELYAENRHDCKPTVLELDAVLGYVIRETGKLPRT